MVLPQLGQVEELQQWDFTTILDQLAQVYNNPNKVQEAEDKLLALKQGTDSLPTYVAKFKRVLYEARGQSWPDVNKISAFRNGLNSTIRGRLAQQLNLPRTYAEFTQVVQQLAGCSFASSSSSSGPSSSHFPSARNGEPMDLSTVDIGTISLGLDPKPSPKAIIRRPRPASPIARSISPQCREQYRIQGQCVRCGSGMHWVNNCPLLPYSPGSTSKKKVIIAASEDDAESRYDTDELYN